MKHYIFGYGSLVDQADMNHYSEDRAPKLITVKGLVRNWEVAMDNRAILEKYKTYFESCGRRYNGFVTFLNVDFNPHTAVNGILFEVRKDRMSCLDQRERNYNRIDISHLLEIEQAKVWTYMAKPSAKERFRKGMLRRNIVIPKGYYEKVVKAFKSNRKTEWDAFMNNTEFEDIPILDLERKDV